MYSHASHFLLRSKMTEDCIQRLVNRDNVTEHR